MICFRNNLKTGSVPIEITNCVAYLDRISSLNGTVTKTAAAEAMLSQP